MDVRCDAETNEGAPPYVVRTRIELPIYTSAGPVYVGKESPYIGMHYRFKEDVAETVREVVEPLRLDLIEMLIAIAVAVSPWWRRPWAWLRGYFKALVLVFTHTWAQPEL